MEPTLKPKVTAKDFFLNLGVFVVLYTLVATFLTYMFSVINSVLPDVRDAYNYYDPYGYSMRMSVSILIVATPLLVYLLRTVHKMIEVDPAKKETWIRRWGLFLTLFLSIVMLAIDLIVFINTFLGGEIASRFVWKVVVTLLVGAALVWYTRSELKNSFSENRKNAVLTGWIFGIVILASIVFGFTLIGSPTLIRAVRDDNQREMDLQNLNGQILNYYQSKGTGLPVSLEEMTSGDPYATKLPTDPVTKQGYKYEVVRQGPKYVAGAVVASSSFAAYKLCATFDQDGEVDKRIQDAGGTGGSIVRPMPVYDSMYYGGYESRFDTHPAGEHCFDISIDPQRYPPYNLPKGI